MDKKRRISIPVKMRNKLGNKVVITKEVDKCLTIYPIQEWKKRAESLQGLTTTKRESRAAARFELGAAVEVDIDGLGRILVPEYLTKFASIQKDVEIVGLGNRIELWDKKKWALYSIKIEKDMPDLIEKLEGLGV